jgi:Protein of unknown function (DUF3108)
MKMQKCYYITVAYTLCAMIAALPAMAGYQNASLRYDVHEPQKMNLKYDVYAGGFKAMQADLVLDLDKTAYDMEFSAQTQGFIGSMFPWQAQYVASGHAERGDLVPSMYTATSQWKKKASVTEISFDPHGNPLKTTKQENNKTTVSRDIEPALAKDAVDVLTGTLMMMQNAKNTDKCKGSFPVFDGKRRFNITLQDAGWDTLTATKYSSFSGDALRCTLKVEPVAGFKKKDNKRGWMLVQNHTEERKKPPTLWFAQLEKDGPVVPVRMEIASAYGAVVAHLSGRSAQ